MKLTILGSPGAGKGTQSKVLAERLNIKHISTGEMLRDHMRRKTKIGLLVQERMNNGELIDDDVIIPMLGETINEAKTGYIVDGFPRTLQQAKVLKELTGGVSKAIYVRIADDEILNRMTGRRECPNCRASYHLINNPPKDKGYCDKCDSQLSQRPDDKEEVVKHRIELYHNECLPVIEYYRGKNKLLEVDGSLSIEEVTASILKALEV